MTIESKCKKCKQKIWIVGRKQDIIGLKVVCTDCKIKKYGLNKKLRKVRC